MSDDAGERGTGRLTIEVLGRDDEGREEHAMPGAVHALGDLGEPRLEAVEVDKGAEEGGDLYVGLFDEDGDEGLEGREGRRLVRGRREGDLGGRGRRRREGSGRRGAALDHFDSLLGEVG